MLRTPRSWMVALALALVGSGAMLVPAGANADPLVLDRVVAVVNDEIILESDLDKWMVFDEAVGLELSKIQNPTEPQLIAKLLELRPQSLDELIARKLMLDAAANPQFEIKASDADVDNYLAMIARGGGMAGIPELKRAVEESGRYGTWAEYTGKLREDVIIFRFEEILVNVTVSDAQVLERYRQLSQGEESVVEVYRLAFQPESDDAAASDVAFKQAKAVVRRLTDGEDPAKLAEELGQPSELEKLTRGDVARPIAERLFTATAGQVIGPLESGQGFVVFKVETVVNSELLGFEQAKDELKNELWQEAIAKAQQELRDQLRSQAHVEIRL